MTLICSYAGQGNLGDDGIALTLSRLIPHADFLKSPKNPMDLIRRLRRTDRLILGGGTLLTDRSSFRSLVCYLAVCLLAEGMGVPYVILGGIDSPRGKWQKCALRHCGERAERVILRDPLSVVALRSTGFAGKITLLPDPALILPMLYPIPKTPAGGYVAIVPKKNGRLPKNLPHGVPVQVVVLDRSDREYAETVVDRYSARLVLPSTPMEAIAVLGGADRVYSARLHGLIYAAAGGSWDAARLIPLEKSEKIRGFLCWMRSRENSPGTSPGVEKWGFPPAHPPANPPPESGI